jgi:NIMA (never in mitosis gene a)-related kinase 2
MSTELMEEKAYNSKLDIWSSGCLSTMNFVQHLHQVCHLISCSFIVLISSQNGCVPPLPRGYSQSLSGVIKAMLSLNVSASCPDTFWLFISITARYEALGGTASPTWVSVAHVQVIWDWEDVGWFHFLYCSFSNLLYIDLQRSKHIKQLWSPRNANLELEKQPFGEGVLYARCSLQKDVEIMSLWQHVIESQSALNTCIQEAITKREEELRVAMMRREEVAAAMAQREEEIMGAVRTRKREICKVWGGREE